MESSSGSKMKDEGTQMRDTFRKFHPDNFNQRKLSNEGRQKSLKEIKASAASKVAAAVIP